MSALPPYRPTLPAAYSSGQRVQQKTTKKNTLSVDGNSSGDEEKRKQLGPEYQRRRVGSGSGYEGLVFDRTPEETERISRKLSHMLDTKNTGSSPSFLGAVKNKVKATMDIPLKRTTHAHTVTVPSTTIFTRQLPQDGSSSDSALAQRASISDNDEHKDDDHMNLDMYSFVVDDPEKAYAQFMQAHSCYDVIPVNAKLVILDTNLDVSKAFYALVYNSVRSALLWHPVKERLCGMLTITDFILVLLRLYRTEKESMNLEKHLISEWRDVLKKEGKLKKLTTITAGTSLHRAIQVLADTKYHRIPVLDEKNGNPLYFLTHKRILRFLYLYLEQLPRPSCMNETVHELGVGTYHDIQYVHPETPLIECLAKLTSRHMSAMPVIEKDTHVVVDIYARFDAIGLAAQQSYARLDKTVAEALQHRKLSNWYEGVLTCLETDTLWEVVKKLVMHEVHGLVVVNSKNVLRGVLTLSDVLKFMVLRPIMEGDGEQSTVSI